MSAISRSKDLLGVADALSKSLAKLTFAPPVAHVYNPLTYARAVHASYVERYAHAPKELLFVGMNPGPYGMMQTGVPFGEISAVRDWMHLSEAIRTPKSQHAKRPITGWQTTRSEVSGARLWAWVATRFGTPEKFFSLAFVHNYCPLAFLEESGRNRTPDQLPKDEQRALQAPCDEALARVITLLAPKMIIGVGAFAEGRIKSVVRDDDITIGRITHPSPASPAANRGWASIIEKELAVLGVKLPRAK